MIDHRCVTGESNYEFGPYSPQTLKATSWVGAVVGGAPSSLCKWRCFFSASCGTNQACEFCLCFSGYYPNAPLPHNAHCAENAVDFEWNGDITGDLPDGSIVQAAASVGLEMASVTASLTAPVDGSVSQPNISVRANSSLLPGLPKPKPKPASACSAAVKDCGTMKPSGAWKTQLCSSDQQCSHVPGVGSVACGGKPPVCRNDTKTCFSVLYQAPLCVLGPSPPPPPAPNNVRAAVYREAPAPGVADCIHVV